MVRRLLCPLVMLSFLVSTVHAAITVTIPFQAVVKTAAGANVTTATPITFSLYSSQTGGTALWTETQNVTPVNGLINVQLGSVNPMTWTNASQAYYVGIAVGSDDEMTPRIPLGTVPHAATALSVPYSGISDAPASLPPSGPASGDLTGSYPNPTITPNAVDNTKLASDAVSLNKVSGGLFTVSGPIDTIDQQQTIATAHLDFGIQTFTVGLTGNLTAIEIYFTATNTGGSGFLSVNVGTTQSITVASGPGWQTFQLPTPIPVTVGEVLNWTINCPGTVSVGITDGNPYPGGHSTYNANDDFAFRTHVTTMPVTIAAPVTVNGPITASGPVTANGDMKLGSNGQFSAAAAASPVQIIAGQVKGNATVAAGSGFTVSRTSGHTVGWYTLAFNPPFTTPPTISVTPTTTAFIAPQYSQDTSGSVGVVLATPSGYADADFHFIAIGGR